MFDSGYKPCGDRASTADIVSFVEDKARMLDQRLNQVYAALRKQIEPKQKEALLKAQRLWIQYRDANCRFHDSAMGSIHLVNAAECLRMMTENRLLELEEAMRP